MSAIAGVARSRGWDRYAFAGLGDFRLPLGRSRLLLLFVAMNFAFLTLDVALAHSISGAIRNYEWLPVIYGPVGALAALFLALQARPGKGSTAFFLAVMGAGLLLGFLGSAFHWSSAVFQAPGRRLLWSWLIFAPPASGPLSFAGVALVGIVASLGERPVDSGVLNIWGWGRLQSPITKTQILLVLVGLGTFGALMSAILDHSQASFEDPFTWISVIGGAWGTAAVLTMAALRRPSRVDSHIFLWSMIGLMMVGVIGAGFHLSFNLSETGKITVERLLMAAPIFAPLGYANLALLGLLSALKPVGEEQAAEPALAGA